MTLARCHNIGDLRRRARSALPAPLFGYLDGGSDDEWSLWNNSEAFGRHRLVPNYLVDVGSIDLTTRVLGSTLDLPFFLAPTGMSRLFHHGRELAVARAADRFGTMYTLSTLATTSLEDIAAATAGPKMFQIYILKDRGLTREFVDRCKAAGYRALCLTVDMPVAGNRERDRVSGMQMPPQWSLGSLASFAAHPRWSLNYLRHPDFRLANVVHRVDALGAGAMGLIDYVNSQFDRTVTWDDAEWLVRQWDGPFVIKGLMAPADVAKAAAIGASAVMISNHGGRQLDGAPAPVEMVAPIRDRVGRGVELIVDGGIRRGTDIIKALALGADACSIGRAYLYGLAAGGEAGVVHALELLRAELLRDMALIGRRAVADVDASLVSPAGM